MKRDKNFTWRGVDAASLDLKGMKVAIVNACIQVSGGGIQVG
jgi:hypothetical protein